MSGGGPLVELAARRAAETPNAPALTWLDAAGRPAALSCRDLASGLRHTAAAAAAQGAAPGDAALILMHNGPELLWTQLGLLAAGCRAVSADPAHPSFMLRQSLGGTRFRFLSAAGPELLRRTRAAGLTDIGAELPSLAALPAGDAPAAAGNGGELVALTAGSTAMPKAVRLGQDALLAAGRGLAGALALRPGEKYLSLTHLSSPWAMQELAACLSSGAEFCLLDTDPGPDRFALALDRLAPAIIRAPAGVIAKLTGTGPSRRKDPAGDRFPRASKPARLIVSAGTLLPGDAASLADKGYGVISSYGLTEACGIVTLSAPGAGDHGKPLPGTSLNLSEKGEIILGGPALMRGYFGEPRGRPARLEGGLLHTGDSGQPGQGGAMTFFGPGVPGSSADGSGLPGALLEYRLTRDPLFTGASVLGGQPDGPASPLAVLFPDLDLLRRLARGAGIAPPADDLELIKHMRVMALLRSRAKDCLKGLPPEESAVSIRPDPRHPRLNAVELCPDLRLRRTVFMTRFAVRLQAHNVRLLQRQEQTRGRLHIPAGPAPEKADFVFLNIEIDVLRSWMLPEDAVHRTGVKLEKILSAGIPSLLASMERAGYAADYILYRYCPSEQGEPQMRELAASLARRKAGVVGISCFGLTLPFALKTAQELRRLAPDKKIVLGGCGPSGAAEAIIRHCPAVDAVVKGEGELAFPRVLEALRAGRSPEGVPGVTCRNAAGEPVTAPPERIEDLDALPQPTFRYMDRKDYFAVGISTMRGCPNSCKYCGNRHMFGAKVAFRSLDCVLGDMETLYREKQKNFFFVIDEIFTLGRERAIEFCSRAEKAFGGKAAWFCYSTVYALDEDLMEAMAACGCVAVYIGVESGSPGVLKHNKRTETEYSIAEAMRKVSLASRYIASVTIFLVVGFKEESLHDFLETLRLSRSMTRREYGSVRIFWLRPIPLTPVFEENKAELILADTRYHWPPPHHVRWVADLARKDPALAPWVMLVPSPFVYLKKFLYYYFTSQRSRGDGGRFTRLKKRLLGLAIDRLLDATKFMSGVPE